MSAGEIVVKLTLDGEQFDVKMSKAGRTIREFSSATKKSGEEVHKANKHSMSWLHTLRDFTIIAAESREAILNIVDAFTELPKKIIEANAEIERMTAMMRGLSTETKSYAAIQQSAQKTVDTLFEMAKKTPFDVHTVMDSFVKLRAGGLDPLDGSLQALIDSVAQFGGSSEELKRAAIAIQQMGGKGVISMEELRQQLGEAVPTAIRSMATALDMSMSRLVKLISNGSVQSKDALAAMFRQMEIEAKGAALEMSQTWVGLMARMKTQLIQTAQTIGDQGFFQNAKDQLSGLVDGFLKSPQLVQMAQGLGRALNQMVTVGSQVVSFLNQYGSALMEVGKIFVTYKLAEKSLMWANNIRKNSDILQAAGAVMRYYKSTLSEVSQAYYDYHRVVNERGVTAARALAGAQGRVVAAMRAGKIAVGAFGSALYDALGPIGLVAAAVAALTALYDALKDKTKELKKEIDSVGASNLTGKQIQSITDEIAATHKKIGAIKHEIEVAQRQGMNPNDAWTQNYFKELHDKLEQAKKDLKDFEATKRIALQAQTTRDAQKQVDDINTEINHAMAPFQKKYNAEIEAARAKIMKTKGLNFKQQSEQYKQARLKAEQELRKAYIDEYGKELSDLQAKIDKREKITKDANDRQLQQLLYAHKQIDAARQQAVDMFNAKGGLTLVSGKGNSKSKIDQFIDGMQRKLDGLKAKVQGTGYYLSQFMDKLDQGKFGKNVSPQDIQRGIAEAKALDKQAKAYEEARSNAARYKQILDRLHVVSASIDNTFAKKQNQNPFLKDTIQANAYVRKLNEVAKELKTLKIPKDKIQKTMDELIQLASRAKVEAVQATADGMTTATQKLNDALLTPQERIQAQYLRTIGYLKQWAQVNKDILAQNKEAQQKYDAYMLALEKKHERDMETPVQKLADTWSHYNDNMQQVWATTVSNFVDTLATGLAQGKLSFQSFFQDVTKMIIKIQLEKAAAGIISGVAGMFAGPGLAAGTGLNSSANVAAHQGATAAFAMGGIMTEKGPLALKAYQNGGIADRPQLAMFGEGSTPEAYVPLPDGRTIPVTVTSDVKGGQHGQPNVEVNVINQSGQDVKAHKGMTRFDGKKFVLDVVLEASHQAGPFRDGMRKNLR